MTIPNLVTSARLIFFAGFIYLIDRAGDFSGAAVMFGMAWGLDAADGWLARRLGQETAWGFIYDKVVDRMVLVGGVLILVAYGIVPWYGIFLLVKDVTAALIAAKQRGRGGDIQDMGWSGKAMSVLQGTAVVWLVLGWGGGEFLIAGVAGLGFLAGGWYGRKLLRQ